MATPPKLSFDIQAATEAGLSSEDIARHVSGRRGYDYKGAREAGLSDDDIIQYNVADVRDVGGFRLAAEEAALTAGTTAPASLYGLSKGFSTGLARTPGPPIVKLFGGIGGALLGGGLGAAAGEGAKAVIREATDTTGQLTPGTRPFEIGGETLGFVVGGGAPAIGRGVLAKIGQTGIGQKLGISAEATVNPVNLGSAEFLSVAADNPGMINAFNRAVGGGLAKTERFLTGGFETAARSPGIAALTETVSGTAAGVAGGTAEVLDPGDLSTRLIAELVAGLANPTSLVLGIVPDVARTVRTYLPGGGGAEARAANKLAKNLAKIRDELPEEAQASFDDLASILREEIDDLGIDIGAARTGSGRLSSEEGKRETPVFTAAEKTNNLFLKTLQQIVMQRDPKARQEILNRSRAGTEAVSRLVDDLFDSYEPSVLAAASRAQQKLFRKRMEEVLNLRITSALERIAKMETADSASKIQAGTTLKEGIIKALNDVREIEKQLYSGIDQTMPMSADNVVKAYDTDFFTTDARTGQQYSKFAEREATVPPFIRAFINRARGGDGGVAPDYNIDPRSGVFIRRSTNTEGEPLFKIDKIRRKDDLVGRDGDLGEAMAVDKEEVGRVLRRSDGKYEAQTALYRRTREQDDIVGYRNAAYDTEEEAIASLVRGRGDVNKDDLAKIKGVAPTDVEGINSGDLIKFRSEMLRLAREAKGEGVDAGFYSQLALAADKDMGAKNFQKMSKEQIDQLSKEEYAFMRDLSAANAFSKQLNDVFTRAFGGDLVAKTASGRDRIIPELAAEKFLAGSGEAATARSLQLDEAINFAINASSDVRGPFDVRTMDLDALRGSVKGAEESILRAAAADALDETPEGPRLNIGRLRTFLRKKGGFIQERYPNLYQELQDANTAEVLLRSTQEGLERSDKQLDKMASFRAFLGKDTNPTAEIDRLVGSPGVKVNPNAEQNLNRLIAFARKAKDENVMEGLKLAIYDAAYNHAQRSDGSIDFNKLNRYLFEPMARKQSSVMDVLQRKGLLADADGANEFKSMKELITRGRRFQETLESGRLGVEGVDDAELITPTGVFESFVARVIGANAASRLASKLGFTGGEIAVPAAGAQAAQTILTRMPQGRAWETLTEAVKDPKLMAELLAKAETRRETEALGRNPRLKAVMTTAGGRSLADILEPSKYRGTPTDADRRPEAVEQTRRPVPIGQTIQGETRRPVAPMARQVAPQPQPAAPRPQAAAPQSNLQQSRRQFAELFPTDITSGIIRGQG